MPKAGQSMEEGTIVKWHVKPGQQIKKGQVIFEIETDKATMDVEATDAGRLARIVLPEGGVLPSPATGGVSGRQRCRCGRLPRLRRTPPQTSARQFSRMRKYARDATAAPTRPAHRPAGRPRQRPPPQRAKPLAAKGISSRSIPAGTGPGGRILSTDVLAAKAQPAQPAAAAGRRKMSKMRKAIADNLLISKQTIPHFYIRADHRRPAPCSPSTRPQKAKYPCSVNDVVVLACAKAIMEFPAFRSHIEGDEIVESADANIGIAVGMDEGLVVPVLLAAAEPDPPADRRRDQAPRRRPPAPARSKAWARAYFTITNLGMFGVEEFAAIINPPESAILAVGAIREAVIVKDGAMRPGRVMTMTLSADHRVVDGLLAAKFMARLKELLENPNQLQS